MSFVGNLMLSAAVKEFCKSIKNWQSYSHGYGGTLFWLTVYFAAAVNFFFLLFSSPILVGRRLDVYHTSTHDVALGQVQI